MLYLDRNAELRNDEVFGEHGEGDHHVKVSPLATIIPMVTAFPPEAMHLVYLGVVRRILKLWTGTPRSIHSLRPCDKF